MSLLVISYPWDQPDRKLQTKQTTKQKKRDTALSNTNLCVTECVTQTECQRQLAVCRKSVKSSLSKMCFVLQVLTREVNLRHNMMYREAATTRRFFNFSYCWVTCCHNQTVWKVKTIILNILISVKKETTKKNIKEWHSYTCKTANIQTRKLETTNISLGASLLTKQTLVKVKIWQSDSHFPSSANSSDTLRKRPWI